MASEESGLAKLLSVERGVLVDLHEFHTACAHTDRAISQELEVCRSADRTARFVFVVSLIFCPITRFLVGLDEVG